MARVDPRRRGPRQGQEFAADIVGYARHVSTVVRDFANYARSAGRDGETEIDVAERLMEAVKSMRNGHPTLATWTLSLTSRPSRFSVRAKARSIRCSSI